MSSVSTTNKRPASPFLKTTQHLINVASLPILATLAALIVGGIVIWITSGSLLTVFQAYAGLFRGAFIKTARLFRVVGGYLSIHLAQPGSCSWLLKRSI